MREARKVVILKDSVGYEKDSRGRREYMLTIVLLLTGDMQEARMAQAYLHENYMGDEYERLLLYCGRDEEALALLDEDPTTVLFDGREAGIAAACNAALQHARGERILFSSASYVLMPSALHAMQRTLDEADGTSLVLPMLQAVLGMDTTQTLQDMPHEPYQDAAGLRRFSDSVSLRQGTLKVPYSLDFCFLTQRRALLEIGGFDEDFRAAPFLMMNVCLRFWHANWPCIAACGAFAHRNEGAPPYEEQDEEALSRKHGMNYPYSFVPRMDILQLLDLQKPSLTVLEVGCACGATLLAVRNANPEARLYGIELNEKAAAVARHFAVVEALDVETLDQPAWHGMFDYIILGDVIEHLREPWQAMKNLAELLKPDGQLVVSFPNVTHFSVFHMMLTGRWQYKDAGLLDRTHLRFFTRTEMAKLLRDAGLEPRYVRRIQIDETPQDEAFIEKLTALLPPEADADELHAYQWIIIAEKRG